MSASIQPRTLEQFLAWERAQPHRYEYDGIQPIGPMGKTGGSTNHERPIARIIIAYVILSQDEAEVWIRRRRTHWLNETLTGRTAIFPCPKSAFPAPSRKSTSDATPKGKSSRFPPMARYSHIGPPDSRRCLRWTRRICRVLAHLPLARKRSFEPTRQSIRNLPIRLPS